MTSTTFRVRSRELLLHLLAEAAELEHNLLCSYLFACFSLKQREDEGLAPHEWQAVERWRGMLAGVCVEEMLHLAQVANLSVAIGSRPHFDRPNLPVAPGYHPARIRVELRRFDVDTVDHLLFLERPTGVEIPDGRGFEPAGHQRHAEEGSLMPSSPDYATIGEFYERIEAGFEQLAAAIGEPRLFLGPRDCQMAPEEIGNPDLVVVSSLADARRAIQTIVVQGEGSAREHADSHYARFTAMRDEFAALRAANPAFDPARPVARNPVMRAPQAAERVHVTGARSAPLLDAANAVYSLMLRCLVELYATRGDRPDARRALLDAVFGAMHAVRALGVALTALPATEAEGSPHAGITFATLRSTEGYAPGVDAMRMLARRFEVVADALQESPEPEAVAAAPTLRALGERLRALGR